MSEGEIPLPSREAAIDDSFASGVAAHFEAYCGGRAVSGPVLVRITLVNGATSYCKGLRVGHLSNVPGCVMIHGTSDEPGEAIVVREEHILSAEIGIEPDRMRRLGF